MTDAVGDLMTAAGRLGGVIGPCGCRWPFQGCVRCSDNARLRELVSESPTPPPALWETA